MLEDSRVKRCCIDATGIGAMMAEQAHEKFKSKVQEVIFTMGSKSEMAYPMKQRFEDRTVTIFDDLKLHADLRSVKTSTTASGNVIFTAEAGASDGHADRFWSHALAIMAADTGAGAALWQRLKSALNRGSSRDRVADRRNRGAFA